MLELTRRRELLDTTKGYSKYDCYKSARRIFYGFNKNILSKISNSKDYEKKQLEMRSLIKKTLQDLDDVDLLDCEKMRTSEKRKKRTARRRIENIVLCRDYPYKLFLTFTFDNDILASTSQDTRHRYVRRWLSQNCIDYVANIDFGSQNDREHYHAVIGSFSACDLVAWQKKCGILKLEKIRLLNGSCAKMATYINKLTNHTNKNLNRLYRLIYARKRKYKTVVDVFDGSCDVSLIYNKNEALAMY